MYVIKRGNDYWTGDGFSLHQHDARRILIDSPTSTFTAYLGLLFDNARFVRLKARVPVVNPPDTETADTMS